METTNQQLTVRQQTLSAAIAKTGNISELSFAKKVVELKKIRELPEMEVRQCLGLIFTKASNLAGLKSSISEINKADIREMILSNFKNLSLEEIDYAFRLDRYSGEPTPHYQLFNAEYVSTVLFRYKRWLRTIRENNNLPISKPTVEKALTEEEKALITVNGVVDCFEEFTATGHIPLGKSYVYDFLFERGLLPKHTKQFKEKIKRKATKKRFKSWENPDIDRRQLKSILLQIKNKQYSQKVQCKEIILETFFKKIMAQGKTISDVL